MLANGGLSDPTTHEQDGPHRQGGQANGKIHYHHDAEVEGREAQKRHLKCKS